jgi:hypothetical protein
MTIRRPTPQRARSARHTRPARRASAVVTLVAASLVASGCGGGSASTSGSTSTSSTRDEDTPTASLPAPGAEFEGTTSADGKFTLSIGDDGNVAVFVVYDEPCEGSDDVLNVDLGPFPVQDDGTIDFPKPGGEGALRLTGSFNGTKASGTVHQDAYDDPKLGQCKELDLRWSAEQTKVGVTANADGSFATGEVLLESDFSQDAAGWSTGNTDASFTGVEDGGLRLNARTKGVVAVPADDGDAGAVRDVVVTLTATFRDGSAPTDSVGITCRSAYGFGYNFYVGRDGRAAIFRNGGEDSLEQLGSGKLPAPVADNEPIELQAACVGGRLRLSVDGEVVARADDSHPWPEGAVALLASGEAGLDVLVDDVQVARPA